MSTAQAIGVSSGIDAIPIEPAPIQGHTINWLLISSLPPFQMFMHERKRPQGQVQNMFEWSVACAFSAAMEIGDEALLKEYEEWHKNKGYWPNETPFGQIK